MLDQDTLDFIDTFLEKNRKVISENMFEKAKDEYTSIYEEYYKKASKIKHSGGLDGSDVPFQISLDKEIMKNIKQFKQKYNII